MKNISQLVNNSQQTRNLSKTKTKCNIITATTNATPRLNIENNRNTIPFTAIPGPKPIPLLGNIWRYFPLIGDYKPETLFENAQFNRKKYGKIVREQLTANHTILHLFDPNDIESFFRQDGKEPFRRSHRALLKYRQSCPHQYKDGGLFPENGAKWSRLRSVFQKHLLNANKISQRAPILDDCNIRFLNNLNEYNVFKGDENHDESILRIENFEAILRQWSLTCSLAILLDYSIDEMPEEKVLLELNHYLHQELEAIDWTEVKSDQWIKRPTKCPFYQRLEKSEKFLYEFVSNRIDYLLSRPETMRDVSFIKDWLQKDKIHRHDVISFVLDSIMASIHTMTFTTTFMLKNISTKKHNSKDNYLMLALKDEINKTLPLISNGPIKHDFSDNMPLLKDCLRETLRLNPVSIGTGRLTQHNEMFIRGYSVPKNVMVIAQTQAICRDSEIFHQADEFRPERWAEYRRQPRSQRPSAFAWLPFGFGPRACIGKRLANLQICTLVARMIQKFSEIKFHKEIKTKTTLIHNIDGYVEVELKKN